MELVADAVAFDHPPFNHDDRAAFTAEVNTARPKRAAPNGDEMKTCIALLAPILFLGCAAAPPAAPSAPPAAKTPATIDVTEAMGSPHPGEAAPDFALTDQRGASVSLSSLRGNVVVVSFVTSWCPYSKAEQPHLAALPAAYEGKPVRFVVIDVQESDAGYRKYLDRVAMPLPVLHDVDGKVTESFVAPGAQPHVKKRAEVPIAGTVVVDATGTIRAIHLADLNRFDVEMTITRATIDRLLAAAP